MDNFSVRTTLNLADWHALMAQAGARVAESKQSSSALLTIAPKALWLVLVAAFVFMLNTKPPLIQPLGIAISLMGFFGTWWLQYFIQRRGYAPRDHGAFLGDQRFDFEAGGFHSRRTNSEAFNRWSLVTDITHTNDHVFLWIDGYSAYVVPVRDLPAPLTTPAAVAQLNKFMADVAAEQTIEPPFGPLGVQSEIALPPSEAPQVTVLPVGPPSLAQELRALLRLHTWGLVDGGLLFGRDATLILLSIVSLALWIGLDRLTYEGEVDLFLYGLTENAAMPLAVLGIAWLLSRTSRPRVELRRGLLLVLGFLPIFIVMMWVAGWLPTAVTFVMAFLVAGWAERFFGAGLRSLTGRRQWMALTSTLIGVVALIYLSSHAYYSPGLWIEREADAEKAAETRRNNEQIVFEQSTRINADISSLAPREAGQPNVFFLGFAGYAGQKVFAEEIGLAAKRIGERYGTAQRSVLLVNDHRDSLKYPLATGPSLRHALNALSQHMNLDEDVLFLALSSHGSKDGTVSVSSELGYWRDLGASELADMLRESGIRWRVIVVSACYAGSFVEPLRNDNTIILTAAAADRTSFGCSDDNDLTYFGEAFYRDALPKAESLRAAFEAARAATLARETHEGMTPSNPQAHFGAALEQKLAAMDALRTVAGD